MFELYNEYGELIDINSYVALRYLGKTTLAEYVKKNPRYYKGALVLGYSPDHTDNELIAFKGLIGLNKKYKKGAKYEAFQEIFLNEETEIYRFALGDPTTQHQPYGIELRDANNKPVFRLEEGYAQIVDVVNINYPVPKTIQANAPSPYHQGYDEMYKKFEKDCVKYEHLPYGDYAVMLTAHRAYATTPQVIGNQFFLTHGHEILKTTPRGFWYGGYHFHHVIYNPGTGSGVPYAMAEASLRLKAQTHGISPDSPQTILVIDVSNLD